MRRIFADSSVLIAGCGSRTGASRAVLTMAEIGLFKLVVSDQVLEECDRNIRKKIPVAMPIFTELLARINPKLNQRYITLIIINIIPLQTLFCLYTRNIFLAYLLKFDQILAVQRIQDIQY